MSIDMSQFLDTFYEESFEGLEVMESELLNLDVGQADPETINTIFRAAHSIKGGSGTFGLNAVSEFTHVMETLLDEMRDGRRQVTQEAVDVLLRSTDVLREMLVALREDSELDTDGIAAAKKELDILLSGEAGASDTPAAGDVAETSGTDNGTGNWIVTFKPHKHLLQTGNDPVRMFRELSDLGEITVEADLSELLSTPEFSAEDCYLSWTIQVDAAVEESQINEIFEWVDGDCDLDIKREQPAQAAPPPQAAAPAPAKAAGTTEKKKSSGSGESASIRVAIEKVDELINTVGELVITQSMLGQFADAEEITAAHIEQLRDGLGQLERNTRELQESVMRIRMLPISFVFQRIPRIVHDLSGKLNKKIELKLSGEQTELDKTVMEKLGDPLVHLVRNSLDHGIETPDKRVAAGKPETGTVHLNAYHQGGNIVIEISDDGGGLNTEKIHAKAIERGLVNPEDNLTDEQVHDLVFRPGFSTADVVSDVSGRGVGMDVVRKNIRSLGGNVDVKSEEGVGSTFSIRLPLTLAILDGQLVSVGSETYIVPLVSIIESIQVDQSKVNIVAGRGEVYKLRDEYIPIVRLYHIFDVTTKSADLNDGLLVVVEAEGQKIALYVDDLLGQQQVVIKSLETNFRRIEGLSGATILGDGAVALILDISGLVNLHRHQVSLPDLKIVKGNDVAA